MLLEPGTPLHASDGTKVSLPRTRLVFRTTLKTFDLYWIEDSPFRGWIDASKVIELNDASAAFDAGIDRGERLAHFYMMRSMLHYFQREYAEARLYIDRAIAIQPANAELLVYSAFIRGVSSDTSEAIALCGRAIDQNPKLPEAYDLRGNLRRGAGRYEEAIADHTRAISLDPTNPHYHDRRGSDYLGARQYDKAIADLNRAVELGPTRPQPFTARGVSFHLSGKYVEALADFDRAIKLDPFNHYAHDRCGWLLATSKDPRCRSGKNALESARQACLLTYDLDPSYFRAVAAAHAELGEFDKAIEWQQNAIKGSRTGAAPRDVEALRRLENKEAIRQ